MLIFVGVVIYSDLWTFRTYWWKSMTTDWWIAMRNRYFWQFTTLFGAICTIALWICAAALQKPTNLVRVLAGGLSLWPIMLLAMYQTGFSGPYFYSLACWVTCGVLVAQVVLLVFGIIKRQWVLPACSAVLVSLFAGLAYWYMFLQIVELWCE